MFISKEIPSGPVNSLNKVFTLLNTAYQIDDIFIDGAIYTSYILNGNIVTLADAPTLSIFIDYTVGITITTTIGQNTFGDIKDEVWDLLGETSNSTNFSTTKIGKKINAKIDEVLKGRVTSLLDPNKTYRVGKLDILAGKSGIRTKAGSILTVDLNIGDTTATADTTTLLGSGYLLIGGDIIHYTSIGTNIINGISGVTVNHLATEKIIQLYETPDNLQKIDNLELVTELKVYDVPYSSNESLGICYNIYKTGTKTLIKIIGIDTEKLVNINYTLKSYDLVNDGDICILPNNYGIKVIAPLVAGEYAYQRGIPGAQQILMTGYTGLQNFYQFSTNKINITKQSIKPIGYSF